MHKAIDISKPVHLHRTTPGTSEHMYVVFSTVWGVFQGEVCNTQVDDGVCRPLDVPATEHIVWVRGVTQKIRAVDSTAWVSQ